MNPARFKAAALPGPTNPGPRKEVLFSGPRHPPRLSQGLLADNSWVSVAQHSPRQPADKAGGPVSPDLRPPPREPSCGSSQEEGEDAATPPSPPRCPGRAGGAALTPEGHEDGEEDGGRVVKEVAGAGRGAGRAHPPVAAGLVAQRAHGDVVSLVTHLHAGREGGSCVPDPCRPPGTSPPGATLRGESAGGPLHGGQDPAPEAASTRAWSPPRTQGHPGGPSSAPPVTRLEA